MMKTMVAITQEMLDAVAPDAIERAVEHSDAKGVVFLQVAGGMWTAYNPAFGQALKKRWQNDELVRNYLISRGVLAA